MLFKHRLTMLPSKHRSTIILFFAIAGVTMSGTLLSHRPGSPSKPSQNYTVPGQPVVHHLEEGLLPALIKACTALELDDDIPDAQKELLRYSVDMYQDAQIYRIKFIAKQSSPANAREHGLEKAVTYWISKATGRVARSTFDE